MIVVVSHGSLVSNKNADVSLPPVFRDFPQCLLHGYHHRTEAASYFIVDAFKGFIAERLVDNQFGKRGIHVVTGFRRYVYDERR